MKLTNYIDKLKFPFELSSISLSQALLFFYVIIASNFVKHLYSHQLQIFFENRWVQHFIGFTIMLVVITNIGKVKKPSLVFIYSLISYFWFLLTTKLDLKWNIAIIGLLILGFMYENKMFDKEIQSKKDESLNKDNINNIEKKNKKIKMLIMISILIVTFLGTIQYINKKQIQYKDNFDPIEFMFKGKCYKLTNK